MKNQRFTDSLLQDWSLDRGWIKLLNAISSPGRTKHPQWAGTIRLCIWNKTSLYIHVYLCHKHKTVQKPEIFNCHIVMLFVLRTADELQVMSFTNRMCVYRQTLRWSRSTQNADWRSSFWLITLLPWKWTVWAGNVKLCPGFPARAPKLFKLVLCVPGSWISVGPVHMRSWLLLLLASFPHVAVQPSIFLRLWKTKNAISPNYALLCHHLHFWFSRWQ